MDDHAPQRLADVMQAEGNARQVDAFAKGEAVGGAEDDIAVASPRPRIVLGIAARRADQHVVEPVGVDIAGRGHRPPGEVARVHAINDEPEDAGAVGEQGEVEGGAEAAYPAIDHIGRAGRDQFGLAAGIVAVDEMGADDDVVEPVAVDVASRTGRDAGLVVFVPTPEHEAARPGRHIPQLDRRQPLQAGDRYRGRDAEGRLALRIGRVAANRRAQDPGLPHQEHAVAGIAVHAQGVAGAGEVQHLPIGQRQPIVAGAGQVDPLDPLDPEIGDCVQGREDAAAIERQRIGSAAAIDAPEGQVGDPDRVVARATDQRIGAALADQRVVALATDHDIGAGRAGQRVRDIGSGMRHGAGEVAAKQDIGLTRTGRGITRAVTAGITNDQVIKAIAVDVTGRGHRTASEIIGVLIEDSEPADAGRDRRELDARAEARGPAKHHIGFTGIVRGVELTIRMVRADDQVINAIAVDVTRRGDGDPRQIVVVDAAQDETARTGRDGGQVDPGTEPMRLAEDHVAFIGDGCADDQVGETIAIHIARRGDGGARPGIGRTANDAEPVKAIAKIRQIDAGAEAAGLAEYDGGHANVHGPAGRVIGAIGGYDQVVEAITVDVSGRGDGAAGLVAGLATTDDKPARPRGDRGQGEFSAKPAGLAEDNIAFPSVRLRVAGRVSQEGTDDEVVKTVAVDVTGRGHRTAEEVAGINAVEHETARPRGDRRQVDGRAKPGRLAEHDIGFARAA